MKVYFPLDAPVTTNTQGAVIIKLVQTLGTSGRKYRRYKKRWGTK